MPDYATTGWPEEEFNSRWQRKLEVKSDAAMAKMRAACRLGRHVMDTVARAIEPGVTTDLLDRICHVVTVSNGAYPSPRNYMGFPKSLCTSVNETVCHGIPDARPLLDGDIVNLDVTVCLDGYHGDLNETYFVEATEETEREKDATACSEREALKARSVALMRCARECLADAIALCAPGARFRDLGEAIQARADRSGFGVVRTSRARHRHAVPLRAERAALRGTAAGHGSGHDVHDRADGERGQQEVRDGPTVDRGHRGRREVRAVRAHARGDGDGRGDPHRAHGEQPAAVVRRVPVRADSSYGSYYVASLQ